MSHYRRKLKTIKRFYRKISQIFLSFIQKQIIRLLKNLFVNRRRRRANMNAGFVLPTVAMVALVVVLMTTAILFRSFERSKHASNVRVNEAVMSATLPSLERAKAKIEQLFGDSRLSSSTPSYFLLEQVINDNIDEFTFGDETQLKLVQQFNDQNNIQDEETLRTAWKYPVDLDKNGKFDSYTLYGIYFRTSTTNRDKSVLKARTKPMDESTTVGKQCQRLFTSSVNLDSIQGWYKVGDKFKKSIFVYTTTVPITNLMELDTNKYETFTGNQGFVALEYQQNRARIPLSNNAVFSEDDLEIGSEEGISLNGRIFTNGNLLTRATTQPVRLYLVSSPNSCYFKEENSKIIVAGNVINSSVTENSSSGDVQVDLFDQSYEFNSAIKNDLINNTNKTVPTSVFENTAAYNDEAYIKRIERLVQATNRAYPNNAELPDEVEQEIKRDLDADSSLDPVKVRDQKLRIYFRKRTRRVPYAEITQGVDSLKDGSYDDETNNPLQGSGNSLRPVDEWIFPFDPTDGKTATNYAEIGIQENGSQKLSLSATDPAEQAKADKEQKIGDRLLVGNNLPQLWFDTTKDKFLSSPDEGQTITGKEWDVDKTGNNTTVTRQRFSQAYQFEDLAATDRDEFWEKSAAQKPQSSLDVVGGLRIVTGAGIYLPNGYTPSSTATQFESAISRRLDATRIAATNEVWADSMPMRQNPADTSVIDILPDKQQYTPFLQMRATAVYHYQDDSYNPKTPTDYQQPIACVSSYYNPTNSTTARNQTSLPDVSLRETNRELTGLPNISNNPGDSNNGVVYSAESLSTTSYENVLNYQAQLKYPNGRWVNEPLQNAWKKITASQSLTLAEQSAVDSAMCALKILDGTIGNPTDTKIPHGAIMETAFLDARQIKAIDKPSTISDTTYDLDVELRQPLEIRATILDLDLLRRKSKTDGEFLFPNSGIIYATRDDALADESQPKSKDISATDFKLDPTRRPNAIMLINGSDISRHPTYKPEEKGLILVSNLPVYIKGNFNLHTQEEFTDNSLKVEKDWSHKFYARQSVNDNFACRPKQFPRCNIGETWRSAVVIADAITVLSDNFRFGFREEGDYDLRNHKISNNLSDAAKINGFWDNNFVTSFPWKDNTSNSGNPTDSSDKPIKSSYFNNFVTPIQRRVIFPEYVMEMCRKLIVAACEPDDWVVGYDANGDGDFDDTDDNPNLRANQLTPNNASYVVHKLGAGTTAKPALNPEDRHYPRRVTFLRDSTGKLILAGFKPIPLGVKGPDNPEVDSNDDNNGQINYYPYTATTIAGTSYAQYESSNRPRLRANALWFQTANDTLPNYGYNYPLWIANPNNPKEFANSENTNQPLLIPVLQIQYPFIASDENLPTLSESQNVKDKANNWMQTATNTETNLIFAQGNTPGRPTESNGGLENFVRYLERWKGISHTASGSFIQFKHSNYATAPWQTVTTRTNASNQNLSRSPFFTPPNRFWSYDTALLSQSPDLFSLHFTTPTTHKPNEFYREVGRDDDWVKTLLCAVQDANVGGYENAPSTYGSNFKYAISSDQRGTCP
ncbi:hormogonium polysaccharide biosynthesis protein HpsA [Brasilonema sp. UFV-L1]|uniref:hormogonium polysaccharide biosynthesis protein HpsA n=1 Tax=Brasilonema sp. UFV-L1 TaxID=2234130 RepID=UPI00145F121A|nr:hormogonium polysaccharide biosynthesis protein HpsA [Brasilonema sp. UFV-L1]NMG10489.1 hypothetical protein [Brasilonema sp. UFV-L1]